MPGPHSQLLCAVDLGAEWLTSSTGDSSPHRCLSRGDGCGCRAQPSSSPSRRADARAGRRHPRYSPSPSPCSPGDQVWLGGQAQFMSMALARAQWCHPDTYTSCRPGSPGPCLSQAGSRSLRVRCRDLGAGPHLISVMTRPGLL